MKRKLYTVQFLRFNSNRLRYTYILEANYYAACIKIKGEVTDICKHYYNPCRITNEGSYLITDSGRFGKNYVERYISGLLSHEYKIDLSSSSFL